MSNGLQLNFTECPTQGSEPFEYPRGDNDFIVIDNEVGKLLKKGVFRPSEREDGDHFSSLFTREKKDGTYRTILNLKSLNQDCDTAHFKMESLKQALYMVRRGSYLASIDIKDAFYSVPINEGHRKYLKFSWDGNIFQFCAMPNGYCDAMRVFTKILKPVFATLREEGHESAYTWMTHYCRGTLFRNVSTTWPHWACCRAWDLSYTLKNPFYTLPKPLFFWGLLLTPLT